MMEKLNKQELELVNTFVEAKANYENIKYKIEQLGLRVDFVPNYTTGGKGEIEVSKVLFTR